MIEYIIELDKALFVYLNSLNNDFFDSIFLWVTEKYSWLFLYLLILLLVAWRYMAVRINVSPGEGLSGLRLTFDRSCWPWLLLGVFFLALLIALADQVSVHLFKEVFQRLRPSHEPEFAEFIHLPRRKGGMYGFVSGHATGSFAVAYFTSRIIGLRWYTWLIFIWAVIFSYSRIYIGVHYPGDSIFGALLGISLAWMLLRVWKSMGRKWFPSLLPARLQ